MPFPESPLHIALHVRKWVRIFIPPNKFHFKCKGSELRDYCFQIFITRNDEIFSTTKSYVISRRFPFHLLLNPRRQPRVVKHVKNHFPSVHDNRLILIILFHSIVQSKVMFQTSVALIWHYRQAVTIDLLDYKLLQKADAD